MIRHDRYFSTCNHYINQISQTIRLVPGLSVATIKAKLDKELSLWYCLRCINSWGSGVLTQQNAIDALICRFNYSRSAAYRILQVGDGLFWEKRARDGTTVIVLSGLQKLADYFDTSCGNYFIEIPIISFVGSGNNRVRTQRSWLYATFYKPLGCKTNPISRACIHQAIGVKRRTQQRYDNLSVRRIHNYANHIDSTGKIIPKLELVDGKSRRWLIQKQLGNSYFNLAQKSARGIIRKINRTFNQSSYWRGACFKRRFFASERSFIKCLHKFPDFYLSIKNQDTQFNRGMQWCTS